MRIAVLGDVHGFFSEEDVNYFNESLLDLILLVGDLPGHLHKTGPVARQLSRLKKPALLIPGNHDGTSIMQVIGEIRDSDRMVERHSPGQEGRVAQLVHDLGPVTLAGYSLHPYAVADRRLQILAARPHSMGGRRLGFRPYLQRRFGVASMEESARRLVELVDQSDPLIPLLFLAHNGPTGLGSDPHDIWGCDFRKDVGDFGDPDLAQALAYARTCRRVVGVVAGHMHWRLKGGGERIPFLFRDGLFFLNPARVPRIFKAQGQKMHQHFEIQLEGEEASICEVLVDAKKRVQKIYLKE